MRKIHIALLAATVAGWTTAGCSPDTAPKKEAATLAADNTGQNVRDRGDTLTSGDQSETEGDRTLTQKVRQAVVADDSLSTSAKNVKIITVNGVVTLRGPVKDEQERTRISAAATTIAGAGKVQNQLEIATP